jgi:prepilin-type N-terminal cleavage/methylation domain-containing protein
MATGSRRIAGFTLIELMITVAVFVTLALLAAPSFYSLRQRSAIRDAGDQTLSFWNQARFEAAKRNQYVKVGVKAGSGTAFCLGAATTTDASDTTPCDCTTASPSTNACDVARYPNDQNDWRNVTLSGTPTLGSNSGVAVIDPRLTSLADATALGSITLAAPAGSFNYKLILHIDQMGRGVLCESNTDARPMSDYTDRLCAP